MHHYNNLFCGMREYCIYFTVLLFIGHKDKLQLELGMPTAQESSKMTFSLHKYTWQVPDVMAQRTSDRQHFERCEETNSDFNHGLS